MTRHPNALKPLLYRHPLAGDVTATTFEHGRPQTVTVYRPPADVPQSNGIVVLVVGGSDLAARPLLGCAMSEMEAFTDWARLFAASGLYAVTYTTREDPARDLAGLVEDVRNDPAPFGVPGGPIGLWAVSMNVPNALGCLMADRSTIRCAALSYGWMLDVDGATWVADAQRAWGFANPAAERSVRDVPPSVPIMVVRCGRDSFQGINESIDAFVRKALERNVPLTLQNHATAPHAFDLDDPSETTLTVIEDVIRFFSRHLAASASRSTYMPIDG